MRTEIDMMKTATKTNIGEEERKREEAVSPEKKDERADGDRE